MARPRRPALVVMETADEDEGEEEEEEEEAQRRASETIVVQPKPTEIRRSSISISTTSRLKKMFKERRSNSVTSAMIKSLLGSTNSKKLKSGGNQMAVTVILPDGTRKKLSCDPTGVTLRDLLAEVVMEERMCSYRVYLASSRALLDLDADAGLVDNATIRLDGETISDHPDDPRLSILLDLLRTEKLYQECLRSAFETYAEPLRKFSSLSADDHRVLFFCLEPLLSLSTTLCLKVDVAIQTWDPGTSQIGSLFSKQLWHHYDEYYDNYRDIRMLLKEKRSTDPEFVQFCLLRRQSASHSLDALCLKPVQRIADYDRYLSSLSGLTSADHPDRQHVSRAADRLANMAKDRRGDLLHAENEHRVEAVQDRFPSDDLGLQEGERKSRGSLGRRKSAPGAVLLRSLGGGGRKTASPAASKDFSPDPSSCRPNCLANPNRVYILEGAAQFTVGLQTQERYLFLFNDLLLVAKQKSSTTFKLKHRVRVCEIWLSDCLDEVSVATHSPEKSFVIGWPTTNAVVTFASSESKDLWQSKIREHITSEKGQEQPRAIILKVMNKDMASYSASKCVTVGNQEEAKALVERCLTEFHIQNANPRDYQLWVASGDDDAPYPLIGHEHPYSIKMTHVRDTLRDRGSGEDISMLPHDQDLNDQTNVQFILRQSKKVARKSSFEENTKRPKKTKRSPIINFFRRSQVKLDDSSTTPTGKLFGHPLSDVCQDDDSLPKPLLELLKYLFISAPFTTGVFRKPGNHKRMQEVRCRMDQGEEIQWDDVPVLVATSILKEYLRSLPVCLLLCELFEQWVELMNISNLDERKTVIIKFLQRLPSVHLCFLRHMMCVFYHIMQRSDENHMAAQALAVCISPSLLWQNDTFATGNAMADTMRHTAKSEKARKLFQFMLEHIIEIFGRDVIYLFGELPSHPSMQSKCRQDSSTDSDSMHSMLSAPENTGISRHDNSSIDSLDRDIYYNDPDPSPQMLMKAHFSPTNLSRDSGLTNSDPRLYEDSTEETYTSVKGPKPPMLRSVSQNDRNQLDNADPGQLSRSYDATLDTVHSSSAIPVPPPRSRKMRKGGSSEEEMSKGETKGPVSPAAPQTIPPLRHSSSALTVSDIRRQMKNAQSNKRVSDDSLGGYLGSLDEDDDIKEQQHQQQQLVLIQNKSSSDIGVLKKSSSGAHLYVREDGTSTSPDQQQQRQNRKSAPPEVKEVQKILEQAKANVHRPRKERVWQKHPPVTRSSSSPLSPPAAGSPSTDSPDGLNDSVLFDYTYMVPVESKTEDSVNQKVIKRPLVKSSSVDNASCTPSSQGESPRSVQMKQPHRHTPINAPEERLRPKSLLRADAVEEEEVLQKKGMTSKGADLFPAHMKKLYRTSLDESAIMQSLGNSNAINDHVQTHSSHQEASCQEVLERKPSCALPQRLGVEKSASETSLNDASWHRPKHPPTYQEAIQRKTNITRNATPQEEIERQRQKNAMAKKLYEDSVKKADEVVHAPEPKREISPPCYETACQRAEQLKEQKGSLPTYKRRDQSSPSNEILRKSSDHLKEKAGSRESTPTRSDSSREGSMNRKHGRRSKDRRIGHRNSDTKLNSPSKFHRPSEGNLNRSKSDSAEHINKISKLNVAKDNKENVGKETTPEKALGRCSTPERKHSLERIGKTTKDRENERMRRKSLTKSTENISFKSLAENLQQSEAESDVRHETVSLTRSVKNRNWHRDLAEQYSDNAMKVPSVVNKYSYASKCDTSRTQEPERSRRRWTPIVHPTKDLVISQVPNTSNRNSAPVRRAQSHVGEYRHRLSDPVGSRVQYSVASNRPAATPARSTPPSRSNPPARTTPVARSSSSGRTAPSSRSLSSGRPMPEAEVASDNRPATAESKSQERSKRSLGWSVSELRNNYVKEDTDKPLSRTLPQKGRRPYSERTNPSAEEAYV